LKWYCSAGSTGKCTCCKSADGLHSHHTLFVLYAAPSSSSSSSAPPAGGGGSGGASAPSQPKKARKPKEAAAEVNDDDVMALHASGGDAAIKKLAVDSLKKWLKAAKVSMPDGSKVMWAKVKKADLMDLATARITELTK